MYIRKFKFESPLSLVFELQFVFLDIRQKYVQNILLNLSCLVVCK
jgi:hypothetical protein